jgi:hypothetical protein
MRQETSLNEEIVFRDHPIAMWFMGIITSAMGIGFFYLFREWEWLVVLLLGIVVIGFASILTISVNRKEKVLSLHYKSLFRVSTKTYSMDEICDVNVAEDREGERMYRLELIFTSGQAVPLRMFYRVGRYSFECRAQKLRSALGMSV